MSACGSLLDLVFEPSSGPGTPQATQSAPASIREFDLPSKYLEPARRTISRRSSEGDCPQYFDFSTSHLYAPRLIACSRATFRTTDILYPTTVKPEDCPTLIIPGSMAASFVESERGEGPPQYSLPPGTPGMPTEDVHIDLNGTLSTFSDKRNERLIWALNRQLAMQDTCPRAPHPSMEDEPINTETASHSEKVNFGKILSMPETPLEFCKLRFGSQMSFNTSVRDLIQESPDTPIGTKVLAQKSYITSTSKGPLGSLTNFSEQLPMLKRFRKGSSSKAIFNSEASSCMTASAIYVKKRAGLATDLSYDGPAGDFPESGTEVRDFAFKPARRFLLHDQPISPLSHTPIDDDINTRNAINGLDGFFSERRVDGENKQSTSIQQSQGKESTKAPRKGMEQLVTRVLPIDTTDENSAPSTPQGKKSKRSLPKRVRRRVIGGPIRGDDNTAPLHRRIRGKILVTPVLSVVIGRQLAKPTRKLLKELAKTAKAVPSPEILAAAPSPI